MLFFFFNDTATTEIYTLSLHDALPIWGRVRLTYRKGMRDRRVGPVRALARQPSLHARSRRQLQLRQRDAAPLPQSGSDDEDRKSTRLNSSHANISYAVFCLKKKKTQSN